MLNKWKSVFWEHLKKCPEVEYKAWMKIPKVKNKAGSIEKYRYFLELPSLVEKNNGRILEEKIKYCFIQKGDFEYGFFNMCFLNNMVGNIVWALSKGYIPYITNTLWEDFFLQPIKDRISLPDKSESIQCPAHGEFSPNFRTIYNNEELKVWSWVYQKYVKLNEKTAEYVEREYETLLKGKKVLGVICRGTDYTSTKPKYHPIQPEIDYVLEIADKKLKKYNLDYIYLATEEKKIVEQFEERFPGRVIVNKREYYDEKYYNENKKLIWEVHFDRINDNYYKGLEYLSSLLLLSRCSVLIGGNCGGALGALLFNGLSYQNYEIFDLGLYGVDDLKGK